MQGIAVRKILSENKINLAWLAEQLGISPQGLNSRLNAKDFKYSYLLEITQILGKDIFGVVERKRNDYNLQQPILDIRVCAGNGIDLSEGDENKVLEYVTIPAFAGCIGVNVYGDSMQPVYKPGDYIFVRPISDPKDIDFGSAYLVITTCDRVLKVIYESKKGDEYLRLASYNTDTNGVGDRLYPDRNIEREQILFLYKVVGSLTRCQI